jgi:hypothetical protein
MATKYFEIASNGETPKLADDIVDHYPLSSSPFS